MPYWYHGTDFEAAHLILDSGFQPLTYFGRSMEDALDFGGDWVFEVWFDKDPVPYPAWQWRCREVIPANRIHVLVHLTPKVLYRSHVVELRVRRSHLEPGQVLCETCQGRGQLEDVAPYVRRSKQPVTMCSKCNGNGFLSCTPDNPCFGDDCPDCKTFPSGSGG